MEKKKFRSLYDDLSHRVKEEGKKNPSWIMGYFQGLGNGTLTGYQAAALVDLLLVPLEKKSAAANEEAPAVMEESNPEREPEDPEPEKKAPRSLMETLARR